MNSNCHKLILLNTATLQKIRFKRIDKCWHRSQIAICLLNQKYPVFLAIKEVRRGLPLFVPLLVPQSKKVKIFLRCLILQLTYILNSSQIIELNKLN